MQSSSSTRCCLPFLLFQPYKETPVLLCKICTFHGSSERLRHQTARRQVWPACWHCAHWHRAIFDKSGNVHGELVNKKNNGQKSIKLGNHNFCKFCTCTKSKFRLGCGWGLKLSAMKAISLVRQAWARHVLIKMTMKINERYVFFALCRMQKASRAERLLCAFPKILHPPQRCKGLTKHFSSRNFGSKK